MGAYSKCKLSGSTSNHLNQQVTESTLKFEKYCTKQKEGEGGREGERKQRREEGRRRKERKVLYKEDSFSRTKS